MYNINKQLNNRIRKNQINPFKQKPDFYPLPYESFCTHDNNPSFNEYLGKTPCVKLNLSFALFTLKASKKFKNDYDVSKLNYYSLSDKRFIKLLDEMFCHFMFACNEFYYLMYMRYISDRVDNGIYNYEYCFRKRTFKKFCEYYHYPLTLSFKPKQSWFDFFYDIFSKKQNICGTKLITKRGDKFGVETFTMRDPNVCVNKVINSPFIDLGLYEYKLSTVRRRKDMSSLNFAKKLMASVLQELCEKYPDLDHTKFLDEDFLGLDKNDINFLQKHGVLQKIKHEEAVGYEEVTKNVFYSDNFVVEKATRKIPIGYKIKFLKKKKLSGLLINRQSLHELAYCFYWQKKNVDRNDILNIRKHGIAEKEYSMLKKMGKCEKPIDEYERNLKKNKKTKRAKEAIFDKKISDKGFKYTEINYYNLVNNIYYFNTHVRNSQKYEVLSFNKDKYIFEMSSSSTCYSWIATKQFDVKDFSSYRHESKFRKTEKHICHNEAGRR